MKSDPFQFIDTHCHFDFSPFSNTQKELDIAFRAGVQKIIIPAIGDSNWQQVQQLSEQYPSLYYSLGLHPYFIEQHHDNALEQLEACLQLRSSKCVAIGECGLDFMLDDALLTPKLVERQYHLLDAQIQLSVHYSLPLILHARRSHDKILQRLRQVKPKKGGVIHAFSGSYQQAMEYVKLGFYIGVGGIITYPRAQKTRNTMAQLPLSSLVLETDAPDMPLSGYQGEPNHPAQILGIFKTLCTLREESELEVKDQILKNTIQLFELV
ncbi:TatD family hydrolase [Vibrio rumoiensis]|uniref:Deoxyribonuclease n=1 Tax=Vibrio rumoiensis 1S-45 TaxID=1188252 RepID=A0A1E5E2T6_9VIBR|nr:TatD family hydrolase [Vibrio rumoiensis]OEF25851.1 deoxyribonuclease [Vibrio rumoiensis 1S-45]